VGTPDYSDLLLDKYISVIEIVNPMHRMWVTADGINSRWRTDAIGEMHVLWYFAIISKFTNLLLLVCFVTYGANDGANWWKWFHYVDEAAPPALMRALALEILRRKLSVTWWTNIRFEKSFSRFVLIVKSPAVLRFLVVLK
jgi:hypothetical protein